MKKLATVLSPLFISVTFTSALLAVGYDFSGCAGTFGDKVKELGRFDGPYGDEEARRTVRIDHLYHVWQKSVAIEGEWWNITMIRPTEEGYAQLAEILQDSTKRERLGGWNRKLWNQELVARARAIATLQREFDFFRLRFFQNLSEKYVPLDISLAKASSEQIKEAAMSTVSEIAQMKEFSEDEDLPDYIDIDTHAQPLFPVEFETTDPVELSKAEETLQIAEELSVNSHLPAGAKEWLRQSVKFFRDLDLTPNAMFIDAIKLLKRAEDLNINN